MEYHNKIASDGRYGSSPVQLRIASGHPAVGQSVIAGLALMATVTAVIFRAFSLQVVQALVVMTFAVSAWALALQARKGRQFGVPARIGFIGAYVFWYALPGVFRVLQSPDEIGGDPASPFGGENAVWSLVYLSTFFFAGVMGTTLPLGAQRPRRGAEGGLWVDGGKVQAIAFACCLIGGLPYVLSGTGFMDVMGAILESRAVEKVWRQTGNLGNATTAFAYVTSSLMTGGACVLWIVAQDRTRTRLSRVVSAIIALIATTVIYFDQGTRSVFALVAVPGGVLAIVRAWRKSGGRALMPIVAASGLLLLLFQFQLLYRATWTRGSISEELFVNPLSLGGTSDFFTETLHSVSLVPSRHDFFHESALLQFLVSPIPRFLWPDKPIPQIVQFYSFERLGIDISQTGGNVLPGIVGQFYMSWGWIGVVEAGLLLGLLARRADLYLQRVTLEDSYRAGAALMFITWLFISYRFLSPGFSYPVLAAALIVRASRGRVRRAAWPGRMR